MTGGTLPSTPPAASRSAEPGSAAARHQRVLVAGTLNRRPRAADDDARDDFHARLELAAHELGQRAVGDADAQVDGLELLVDVKPRAAGCLHGRERREQR